MAKDNRRKEKQDLSKTGNDAEKVFDFTLPIGWFDADHAGEFLWTPERHQWAKDLWAAGIWWMFPCLDHKSTAAPPIVPGAALCARQEGDPRPTFNRYSYTEPDRFEGIAIDHPLACPEFTDWAVLIPPWRFCEPLGVPSLDLTLAIADVLSMTHGEMQRNPKSPRSGIGPPARKAFNNHCHESGGYQFHTLATSPEIWKCTERPPPLTWYAIMGALAVQLRWRMQPLRSMLSSRDSATAIRDFAVIKEHPVVWHQATWDLLRAIRRELDRYSTLFDEGETDRAIFPSAPSHSDDFTSVNWYGTKYSFSKGNQAQVICVLWEAWENGGHSLNQETIGEKIGSSATRFQMRKTFRRKVANGKWEQHPAWGTMIQQESKGCYRLVEPE